MILTIDIGNSNIVIGCVDGEKILFRGRVNTDRVKTSDQYCIELKTLLEIYGLSLEQIEGSIISSVVPQVLNSMQTAVAKLTGKSALVVGPGLKTGLNILLDNPAQMGADLVVADVAALREYQPPLIVIDMGTATTMAVLDQSGAHLGGCVCPGVQLSMDALTQNTSLLPGIQLSQPQHAIGRNTADAMRSGIMMGTASMLDGMIDRFQQELGQEATILATGGIARFLVPLCNHNIIYDRDLLIKGLAILYRENTRH